MTKEELRALYKQIRLRMSRAEVSTKSRAINKSLINELMWEEYESICVFRPIASLNEVDIGPLIKRLDNQSKDLYLLTQFKKAELPQTKFDLIIVPSLAFDKEKFRLGWGGGFYDKFLAQQPQALKVGVCFQNGFAEGGLEHEPHDISVDKVITESKIY
jgi:5-formyltetrahydrofolate cyclo-ligase